MWLQGWTGYGIAAFIGYVVGWVELGQRYSDTPMRVLRWPAAWLYLITNAVAALLGLVITRAFHWTFGQAGDALQIVQVLVSGLGAMALFRAKLFTAAQAADDGGVKLVWSPASLLEGILNIADRQARREQARDRIRATRQMAALTWAQAERLAPIVLAAMGTGSEEQKEFAKDFNALVKNPDGYSDDLRTRLLGLAVSKFAGPAVLRDAISEIKHVRTSGQENSSA
jgi:hypothetical protein